MSEFSEQKLKDIHDHLIQINAYVSNFTHARSERSRSTYREGIQKEKEWFSQHDIELVGDNDQGYSRKKTYKEIARLRYEALEAEIKIQERILKSKAFDITSHLQSLRDNIELTLEQIGTEKDYLINRLGVVQGKGSEIDREIVEYYSIKETIVIMKRCLSLLKGEKDES